MVELRNVMSRQMDVSDLEALAMHLGLDPSYLDDQDDDSYKSEKERRSSLVHDITSHLEKNPGDQRKVASFFKD